MTNCLSSNLCNWQTLSECLSECFSERLVSQNGFYCTIQKTFCPGTNRCPSGNLLRAVNKTLPISISASLQPSCFERRPFVVVGGPLLAASFPSAPSLSHLPSLSPSLSVVLISFDLSPPRGREGGSQKKVQGVTPH